MQGESRVDCFLNGFCSPVLYDSAIALRKVTTLPTSVGDGLMLNFHEIDSKLFSSVS